MSERLEINLAILKRQGMVAQIVVNPDKAIEYKNGKEVNLRDVLKSDQIFSDAQKGMAASEHMLENVFETKDPLKIADIIIKEGEIQLSAEYRKKLRDQKRNKIIDLLHRNSINPQTNAPHPRDRLSSALDESKVRIEEFKSAEEQIETVIGQIKTILPIRYEQLNIEVLIEAQYAPKSYSVLKSFGTLEDSQWMNDGSLLAKVKLPGGLKDDFMDKLNGLTHGSASIKII